MKSERSSGFTKVSALKSAAGQVPENCTSRKKQVMKSERSSGLVNPSWLKSAGHGGDWTCTTALAETAGLAKLATVMVTSAVVWGAVKSPVESIVPLETVKNLLASRE